MTPTDSGEGMSAKKTVKKDSEETAPRPAPKRYKVLVGLSYPDPKGGKNLRAKPGDIVSDIPSRSLDGLLSRRVIEEY